MPPSMKVSIVIPIYNAGPYIERCLRSVVNQTYPNLECILVNDCGQDDSMKRCEALLDGYEGGIDFKTLHHECNKGVSAARNTGIKHITGEYVFFLDSDDELPPAAIADLVDKANEYPGIELVQGDTISFPDKAQYNLNRFEGYDYITDNKWIRDNYYKEGDLTLPVNAWNKLLKTEFLKTNHLLFKEGFIHEDNHWMWFLVKHLHSMAFVFKKTYIHYTTPNSIMSSLTNKTRAIALSKVLQDLIHNVDDISYVGQLKKILVLYRNKEIINYYKAGSGRFFLNVMKNLWTYKQYKSLSYMLLWIICLPFRDSSKLFRHSIESIGKKSLSLRP